MIILFGRGQENMSLEQDDSTPGNSAQKDSRGNNPSLRGFEVVDRVKAVIEATCKGVVSCANIFAFATRDSIQMTGGLSYDVPAGRKDGRIKKLNPANQETNRGYWDVVWGKLEASANIFDKLQGTKFRVIMQNEDQVEIPFTKIFIPPINGTRLSQGDTSLPINIDKRYIVLRGVPGFYLCAIFERFRHMAVSDTRQRVMPTFEDRKRGRPLAYPEALLLTDPISSDNSRRGG